MRASTLPTVTYRPLRDAADYEHMAGIFAEANAADGIEWVMDAATLRVEHEHRADHDPRADVVFAEVDNTPVG
jgi:hypothetical protein